MDFELKRHQPLGMFHASSLISRKNRLFRLTFVLLVLIGEGSSCKSASLQPSGPLTRPGHHRVNLDCINRLYFSFNRYAHFILEAHLNSN